MIDDALRGRIHDAVNEPFRTLGKHGKSLLIEIHAEVFSSDLCRTCENEQLLAYIQLTRLKQNGYKMAKKKTKVITYKLKAGVKSVHISSKGWTVTATNLTQDQAAWMSMRKPYCEMIEEVTEEKPRTKKD